ncbi:prolyl oligopeptidase family serine peptidase [Microbispora sp. RL4-1S]|uniref:Prolyl oligopeptidase family serine peptidase n=1 Tax=Microbispora oryzae TaxID=2806554 RepID=A0A941AJB0_9ACTN|nr:alpha/beta hydrolase-fold protein [Microbispora oryzae]MBP2704772.1 prolyl oligopeptidase family serine peptidase [Microbispora oryzae]
MELTAKKVQILFVILAVASLAATVWLWPRLSRPTIGSVAARAGVLVADQLVTLVAIGVVVNAYFGFYGSWGDLFGTDAATAAPAIAFGSGIATGGAANVKVLSGKPVLVPDGKAGAFGGRIEQVLINGARTGLSSPGYVYLPPQYFEKKYAQTRFPAILALTGYPGDALNLVTRLNLPTVAATSIHAHQMAPTILVLMRPTVVPPRDTECVDVPGGPQVETYFTRDLRQAVAAAYRVGTDAANWGVLGGSTGGYCALKMSMRHPEAFSAAVSLSGYYHTLVDVTTGDLFGGSTALRDENDLMWRLAHLPSPPISVLVTTSRQGEGDYDTTERFLSAVKPPMQAASLILPSGGHNFATWNRELPQALPWLAQQLHAPARPGSTPAASGHPSPAGHRPSPSPRGRKSAPPHAKKPHGKKSQEKARKHPARHRPA